MLMALMVGRKTINLMEYPAPRQYPEELVELLEIGGKVSNSSWY